MKKSIAFFALLIFTATALFSHSGGLDSNGGHWDRKSGTYHYHRSPAPVPTPTYSTTTTTVPQSYAPASIIVFVTKTGEKYHQSWCQYLSESKIQIQLGDATARAFSPCLVCRPPLLLIEKASPIK